jgi:hypothetical protein
MFSKIGTAVAALALVFAQMSHAAPALTTIQDVLYCADGTRFNGTVVISWTNFQSSDNTPIATQSVSLDI